MLIQEYILELEQELQLDLAKKAIIVLINHLSQIKSLDQRKLTPQEQIVHRHQIEQLDQLGIIDL